MQYVHVEDFRGAPSSSQEHLNAPDSLVIFLQSSQCWGVYVSGHVTAISSQASSLLLNMVSRPPLLFCTFSEAQLFNVRITSCHVYLAFVPTNIFPEHHSADTVIVDVEQHRDILYQYLLVSTVHVTFNAGLDVALRMIHSPGV